jgi:hypothetical protein
MHDQILHLSPSASDRGSSITYLILFARCIATGPPSVPRHDDWRATIQLLQRQAAPRFDNPQSAMLAHRYHLP